jgi:signal transduction histidine kinase
VFAGGWTLEAPEAVGANPDSRGIDAGDVLDLPTCLVDKSLVAVADQGLGIAPGALKTVFQPFERGAQARQAGIPGSGLGLSTGKEIAQAHGGRLWAESRGPGRGATFALALPVRRGEETGGLRRSMLAH